MSGIFEIVILPLESRTALMTWSASFLAPWGVISPLSRLPPVTSKAFIQYFFLVNILRSRLVSFFLEFSSPVVVPVVVPVIVPVIVPVVIVPLKFLSAFVSVVTVAAIVAVTFTVLVGAEAAYKRCIGEFQLSVSDR